MHAGDAFENDALASIGGHLEDMWGSDHQDNAADLELCELALEYEDLAPASFAAFMNPPESPEASNEFNMMALP